MDPLENTDNLTPYNEEEEEDLFAEIQRDQQEFIKSKIQAESTPAIPLEESKTEPESKTQQALQQAEEIGEFPALGGLIDSALDFITPGQRSEETDNQRVAGKGGDERNPFDSIVSQAVDFVDNNFQGDQESLEEIQARMSANRAKKQEEDAQAPALQRALSEPGRALTGSFLGATESALETAEIIGDVSKNLASKIGLVGYNPKEDPFSDQYNWASWNLGKDDLGAQTGVGKITQGFGEFAVTFAALGGGRSVSGLFTKGTTRTQAFLGSAGREALEGVAADMVMAASGEGNLSNLIKENAPDWYPTWLTALAVDEDDNPFEAAFKTAFEGGILGAPIGAVTAYLRGNRAANALKKANPKATPRELNQAAIDAANQSLTDSPSPTPVKYKNVAFKPREVDTRGQGIFYHGASDEIPTIEDFTYNDQNIYGQGFYTTDDLVTANKYQKKNKSTAGKATTYEVTPAQEVNFYDMDQPGITPEVQQYLDKARDINEAVDSALADFGDDLSQVSLSNLFDEIRAYSKATGTSTSEIQDTFLGVQEILQQSGFGGYTHVGGKLTKSNRNHQVRIYWDPKEQLSIKPVDTPAPVNQFDEGALSTIQQMERVGIDPTWDDVAAVTPQYFIPGSRQIESPEFGYDALGKIVEMDPTNPDGVVFVNPFTGETPTSGTMVSIDGAELQAIDDVEAVAGFIGKYYDILTREDTFLKATLSQSTGKPQVEISRLVADPDDAIQLGKLFDQENVFRLDDLKIEKTGGLDQLKRSQGAHLKSISSRAVKSTPVEPQKAAAESLKADMQLNPRGGAQNMLTDNQVARLASAGPTRTSELLQEFVSSNKIDVSELATQAQLTETQVLQNAINKLGDDFGFLPTDVEKLEFDSKSELSREGTVQARLVMQELASRLAKDVFKANDASAKGMNNIEHVQKMVDTLKSFMKVYKISANSVSKKLSAGAIELPKEWGVKGEDLVNRYAKNDASADGIEKQFEMTNKLLDKMVDGLKGNNPKARQQSLRIGAQLELLGDKPYQLAQGVATLSEIGTKYALKIMYNSMLSSPATHIINGTSNAVALILRPLAASVGGDARSRKAAAASYYSIRETIVDSLRMAGEKWKETDTNVKGIDTSSGQASIALEELSSRAAESNDNAFQVGVFMMRGLQAIADMPGMGLPSRLLSTSDEFFKTAIQRMEYKRMIMEKAIDSHGSNANAVWKDLYEAEKRTNFTKSGESLNAELNRIAKEVTFQTDLEGMAKQFGQAVESYPALRIFFPFVRTAHNVAVYTASYVPVLGGALAKQGADKLARQTPYEQSIIRGRQYLGGFFIAGAGMLAMNGNLVGNGPIGSDKKARARWLEQNQPRSLKFGNTFISFDRLEPFGPLLAAVADVHYAFTNGQMEEDRAKWLMGYLGQTIAVNVTDRTFFQGFRDFTAFLYPNNRNLEFVPNFFVGAGNNFIPAAGLRRSIANMLTPYMQEFDSQLDRTLYTSFGVGERATKYDFITGEKLDSLNSGINALLPIKINNIKQDPVKQALFEMEYNSDRIVEELGESGAKLSPEHKTRLAQLMGQSTLRKDLKAIVTAKDWRAAFDKYKNNRASSKRDEDQVFVGKQHQPFYTEVHNKISLYANDAYQQLKEEYPELREAVDAYNEAKYQDRYGGLTDYYQQ